MTTTIKNRSFKTSSGNIATVWNVKSVGSSNGLRAVGKTVRTYVEVCGKQIDIEAGCGYKAEAAVANF